MRKNVLKVFIESYKGLSIVAKATMWFFVCSVVQKCISMLTTPVFTRLMSAEEYSIYTMYQTWLQIFTIFTTLRLNGAVFNKGMSKFKDDRPKYTVTMQSISSILVIICFIIFLLFKKQIEIMTELPTLIIYLIFFQLLFEPAISYWSLHQRYELRYHAVVFITLMLSVFNAVVGCIAVVFSYEKGMARVVSCIMVTACIGLCLYIINILKAKALFDVKYAKFAIIFVIPLIPHYLSTYIIEFSDRIMIQKLVGPSAVAIYSVANNAGLIMKIITESFSSAFIPKQYDYLEKKEFVKLERAIEGMCIFTALSIILFIFVSPEFMIVFAAKEYYSSIFVIPPVSASIVFLFLYTLAANIEFYYNNNNFTSKISFLVALINIILNYLLIPFFGYVAAAYSTLACYMIMAFAHILYVNYLSSKTDNCSIFNIKRIITLSCCFILFIPVLNFLYLSNYLRYFAIVISCVVIYIFRKKVVKFVENNFRK